MSCYMCDNATFSALAQKAVEPFHMGGADFRPYPWHNERHRAEWEEAVKLGRVNRVGASMDSDQDVLARLFALANARSVHDRYGDASMTKAIALDLARAARWVPKAGFDPIVVIKTCHCYAYQSCDWGRWEGSLASKIADSIEAASIRSIPGYREAPWGLAA